jgi:hypothetical protein
VQLADILELVVREGVRRHVEKRAGVVLPLSVGAMIPSIVSKAMEHADSAERQMERGGDRLHRAYSGNEPKVASFPSFSRTLGNAGSGAAGALGGGFMSGLGALGAAPLGGIASGISHMIERKLPGREFGEHKDPFHMGASKAIESFGSELGKSGVGLLRDMANKAMESVSHMGDASAREAIISNLKRTDSVLMNADDKTLMEAYHTMTRFAPVLSTDKNAVRSFLRQAVMSGSGPDYMSIKLLADSERAVTGGDKDHR